MNNSFPFLGNIELLHALKTLKLKNGSKYFLYSSEVPPNGKDLRTLER